MDLAVLITFVYRPTSIIYVNVSQGISENREIQFNVSTNSAALSYTSKVKRQEG